MKLYIIKDNISSLYFLIFPNFKFLYDLKFPPQWPVNTVSNMAIYAISGYNSGEGLLEHFHHL